MAIPRFCGILLIFILSLDSAEIPSFVFNHDSMLNQKSADFMQEVSFELFNKTGVSLYVLMAKSHGMANYADFRAKFTQNLNAPFVALILLENDKKIDIIASSNDILDQNKRKKIYWEYMVPLLPQKNSEFGALSAVMFNGYIEAVDLIADNFGVQINHNIPKNEKGAKLVAQGILYAMLVSMLGIFAFIYFAKRKR